MSEMSDYLENKVIDHMLRAVAWTAPATVYAALFTADTGLESDSPSAEVSEASYARVACSVCPATAGAAYNGNTVTFATATASWGTVSHVALVDHLTNVTWGTNVHVLLWTPVDTPKGIGIGDTPQFNVGDLDITMS